MQMNWRGNAAVFLFGTLLLAGCNTTPTASADPPATPPDTTVRREWFWNPQWWLTNGPIVQEVKDTINQNPWILNTAGRLNAQSNGGSYNYAFDINQATQQWDGNSGLLTVTLPMASGINPAFTYLAIRPTYYFFGPHQWTIEQVGYDQVRRVNIIQPNLPPASVSNPNVALRPDPYVVNTLVPIKPGGALGTASALWINANNNAIIQEFQTVRAATDDDVNTFMNGKAGVAAIEKCYTPPPVSGSSIIVTPVCPPPDACPPGGYVQTANIVATSCAPTVPPQAPAGPDCKKLRQDADNARAASQRADLALGAVALNSAATCIPLIAPGPKKWNDVAKCVATLGSVAVAVSVNIDSFNKRREAESNYADNCAKPKP
jgi:hypothetical protein